MSLSLLLSRSLTLDDVMIVSRMNRWWNDSSSHWVNRIHWIEWVRLVKWSNKIIFYMKAKSIYTVISTLKFLWLMCFTTTLSTIVTFSTFKPIFSSSCRQQRQQQHHHLFTMWCVSKLDFMIISLRATLKSNKKHSSKWVQRLSKVIFCKLRVMWFNLY